MQHQQVAQCLKIPPFSRKHSGRLQLALSIGQLELALSAATVPSLAAIFSRLSPPTPLPWHNRISSNRPTRIMSMLRAASARRMMATAARSSPHVAKGLVSFPPTAVRRCGGAVWMIVRRDFGVKREIGRDDDDEKIHKVPRCYLDSTSMTSVKPVSRKHRCVL